MTNLTVPVLTKWLQVSKKSTPSSCSYPLASKVPSAFNFVLQNPFTTQYIEISRWWNQTPCICFMAGVNLFSHCFILSWMFQSWDHYLWSFRNSCDGEHNITVIGLGNTRFFPCRHNMSVIVAGWTAGYIVASVVPVTSKVFEEESELVDSKHMY